MPKDLRKMILSLAIECDENDVDDGDNSDDDEEEGEYDEDGDLIPDYGWDDIPFFDNDFDDHYDEYWY